MTLDEQGISVINQAIANDLKQHKQCRFTVVGSQTMGKMHIYWGVAKQSPFFSVINKG